MQMQRGTVLQVPTGDRPGLLFVGGKQVSFELAKVWQSPVAPSANQTVEVAFDDAGVPTSIVVVDSQTLAKEKLGEFAGLAGSHGQKAATHGKAAFHKLSERMGVILMAACVVLIVGWFFVPALRVNLGFGYSQSFSVSDILGLDLTQSGASTHFGFWSFLGLMAVLVPWLVPWLRTNRAGLLFCSPLLMLVIAFVRVRWQVHALVSQAIDSAGQIGGSQAQSMIEGMVDQMSAKLSEAVSFGLGFWLVLLISLAFTGMGLQRYTRHHRLSPAH